MKNFCLLILCLFIMLVVFSCGMSLEDLAEDLIKTDNPKTITGTILVSTTNVKIGTFSEGLRAGSGEADVIVYTSSSVTTGNFTPLGTAVITGDSYSLDLPSNGEDLGVVAAWIDTNNDGIFNLGTETGYFPKKSYEGNSIVISSWGYSGDSYQVNLGGSLNISLGIIGASGFDFTID